MLFCKNEFDVIFVVDYLYKLQEIKASDVLSGLSFLMYLKILVDEKKSGETALLGNEVKKVESCTFTSKELDEETGLYYFGARYLDPQTSRWMSPDPALGEYLNSVKRRNNDDGLGGVFNAVNLNLYHYSGNNPLKYVDPDGEKQNIAQKIFSKVLNVATKIEPVKNIVQKITKLEITRDVYKGIVATHQGNAKEKYFKDKMSVKIGFIPLNSVQVQSTPDVSGETPLATGNHSGVLGISGATNKYIVDAIQIDNSAYFAHDNWLDGAKPYSQGCPMTIDHAGMTETKDILRQDLKFENNNTKKPLKINIQDNKGKNNNDNIKKK